MGSNGTPTPPAKTMSLTPEFALAHTRAWIDRVVIGLNLCPFAKAVQAKGQVRYVFSDAADEQSLLDTLCSELHYLAEADPDKTDTTVIVHPFVLTDFEDFNEFLDAADAAVEQLGYAGVLQVATFHPQYQFADTDPDDPTNATNRSPYPTLHLLREESVDRAVGAFPEAEDIFETNMQTMAALGADGVARLQARCEEDARTPPPEV
jgi:hypothetical protein